MARKLLLGLVLVALVAATCSFQIASAASAEHQIGRRRIQDSDEGHSLDAVKERIKDLKRRTEEMIRELRSTTERSFNLILEGEENYFMPSREAIVISSSAGEIRLHSDHSDDYQGGVVQDIKGCIPGIAGCR